MQVTYPPRCCHSTPSRQRSSWPAARVLRWPVWCVRICPSRPDFMLPPRHTGALSRAAESKPPFYPPRRAPAPDGALDALEHAAAEIAALFAATAIDDELAAQIVAAYAGLCGANGAEPDCPVAVRSSATAEDLPELSFRRPAGELFEHPRHGGAARRRQALLGLAVDRPRDQLPRPAFHRAGRRQSGGRGAGAGAGRGSRNHVYRRSALRPARPCDDQRCLGSGRSDRRRAGHARYDRRGQANGHDAALRGRREGYHDRAGGRRHAPKRRCRPGSAARRRSRRAK